MAHCKASRKRINQIFGYVIPITLATGVWIVYVLTSGCCYVSIFTAGSQFHYNPTGAPSRLVALAEPIGIRSENGYQEDQFLVL